MKFASSITLVGGLAAAASAQSICDKYTAALFKGKGGNSAANQQTLLTLVVNTAIIGNYSSINTGVSVPGLLAPGKYDGEDVNLLPYFDGALASTNMGGRCGQSVNFLDGGGAAPLKQNKPADDTTSNQYTLITHLYEFFASLLGCSKFGKTVHKYNGDKSMYETHRFMALDNAQLGWFIENVGLSASSFGVSNDDVEAVGSALKSLFGYRCEPEQSIPPVPSMQLQSICTTCDCPVSPNATCSAYKKVFQPNKANDTTPSCRALHRQAQTCS